MMALLAPLVLPDLHLVLHTSGRTVGSRHPLHHSHPDTHSPHALAQSADLQLLAGTTLHVDATCSPPLLCAKVTRLLHSRVFKVLAAEFEGMEHLHSSCRVFSHASAMLFANALPLPTFTTDAVGLGKLGKLAQLVELNPQLVNPLLPPHHRAPYYQAVYDHLDAFALSLANLKVPAKVAPFEIHTFGAPVCRPPIRCSPPMPVSSVRRSRPCVTQGWCIPLPLLGLHHALLYRSRAVPS